ncbi:MAG: transposase [Peptoclostridium sp.]|nr:transposase [Peptoclostridium sp.]
MKTVKIKLKPTKSQTIELSRLSREYISQANLLIQTAVTEGKFPKATSKHIDSNIPSVIKNELIRYAKTKFKQFGICIFKKPTVSWNNQNYTVEEKSIAFPMIVDGKVKKTKVKALIPSELFERLSSSKLGALRVSKKGFHWIAQIAIENNPTECSGIETLGVDLGILCPAVGVVASTGKTKFFGNGRHNKYLRRKYKELRRALGKAKKLNAIKRINDKESRIMRDINHKISRNIVNFAVESNCRTINLESLSGIRQTWVCFRFCVNAKN